MLSKQLTSNKKENLKSKIKKLGFNFFPAYRRTGARIIFLSDDWKEILVKLSLNWKTKNYVGTVFGGSIYGALDPIYMVQLINILGQKYIVWDKSAEIMFLKPIKKSVYAKFIITDETIAEIKKEIKNSKKYIISLQADFKDSNGIIYAKTTKKIFIADKEYYIKNKNL